MTVEFIVSYFSSKDLLITSRNIHILDLKFLRRLGFQAPSNFEGSDNSFLSILEESIPPVIVGLSSDVITSSSWFS